MTDAALCGHLVALLCRVHGVGAGDPLQWLAWLGAWGGHSGLVRSLVEFGLGYLGFRVQGFGKILGGVCASGLGLLGGSLVRISRVPH